MRAVSSPRNSSAEFGRVDRLDRTEVDTIGIVMLQCLYGEAEGTRGTDWQVCEGRARPDRSPFPHLVVMRQTKNGDHERHPVSDEPGRAAIRVQVGKRPCRVLHPAMRSALPFSVRGSGSQASASRIGPGTCADVLDLRDRCYENPTARETMTDEHARKIIEILQALLKQQELIVAELILMRPPKPTPKPTSEPRIRTL